MITQDSIRVNEDGDAVTIMGITFPETFFHQFVEQKVAGRLFVCVQSGPSSYTVRDVTVDTLLPSPRVH